MDRVTLTYRGSVGRWTKVVPPWMVLVGEVGVASRLDTEEDEEGDKEVGLHGVGEAC